MIEEHKELIRNQENSNEFYRPFDENHSNYKLDIVRNNNQESSRISTHSMEPKRGTGWNINRKLEIDSISSNVQSLVMEFGYRMTDGQGMGSLLNFPGSVQNTTERSASYQYHNNQLRKTLIENMQALNSFEELIPRILRKG